MDGNLEKKPALGKRIVDAVRSRLPEELTTPSTERHLRTHESNIDHVRGALLPAINQVRGKQGEQPYDPISAVATESAILQTAQDMINKGEDTDGVIATALQKYEEERSKYNVTMNQIQ